MDKHNILSKFSINIKMFEIENIKLLKKNNIHFKDNLHPYLKENPIILNNFDDKYINYINTFLTNLQSENPSINLNLFYKNLKTLSIKEKKNFNRLIFIPTNTQGVYKFKKNQIELLDKNYNFCIYHELLHCASYKKDNTSYCTGFFRQYSKFSIGRALNEGYTTLLEKRYFNENLNQNCYKNMRMIADKIEILVDKKIMENLYFTANLNGLINEFIKYGKSKTEIILFMDELDYINCNLGNPDSKILCQEILYDISGFLIDCYEKKCEIYKDVIPNLNSFINGFKTQIYANEISYNFLVNNFMVHETNKIEKYYIDEVNDFKKYYK